MSTTFSVSHVTPAKARLAEDEFVTVQRALLQQSGVRDLTRDLHSWRKSQSDFARKECARLEAKQEEQKKLYPEACGASSLRLLGSTDHPLVNLFRYAWSEHRPLSLSPDAVWLTIAQGLARHIEANAEALRYKFVEHEGKQKITISADDFVKGSAENNWPRVFGQFSEELRVRIVPKRHDLIISNFSTTTPTHLVASEVVLMDALSSYFEYGITTACGFPTITLEGTQKDWEDIRARVRALGEFDLTWWTDHLLPVLDGLVESWKTPSRDFWSRAWHESGGSGGPFVSGWITVLFPYLGRKGKRQPQHFKHQMIEPASIPSGLSVVPFDWDYYGIKFDMEFLGGLAGVEEREDGTLAAVTGWGVRNATKSAD